MIKNFSTFGSKSLQVGILGDTVFYRFADHEQPAIITKIYDSDEGEADLVVLSADAQVGRKRVRHSFEDTEDTWHSRPKMTGLFGF